jgi:3-deoxy-7-phosphoheptulonate synthase
MNWPPPAHHADVAIIGSSLSDSVRDRRIERLVPLAAPRTLIDELPLSEAHAEVLLRGRSEVQAILDGHDDRLLVVVGPCSVHDVQATWEYAERLSAQVKRLAGELCVAMRVYFEKPRTTIGWKGLINDPHLDGSSDVNTGLRMARRLLLDVLALGLPVGCEFLDPITPQYISDVVSWGAIGARTVESQIHRQLGSGLSMPVGFKNRTDGNVQVAVDALRAAASSHAFAGIDVSGTPAILYTTGNRDCHIILRGGNAAPNYGAEPIAQALALLRDSALPERVMVDLSHDNSGKDPARQPAVAAALAGQVAAGNRAIVGVMIESFLVAGRQDLGIDPARPLIYGQSITDGCIGWDTTVEVLDGLADAVRARRGTAS